MHWTLLTAWPWIVFPLVVLWRTRGSRTLDDEPTTVPDDAPLVSVVIPARDEAATIGPCVRAALAAEWPAIEVIVVDDHSVDDTAQRARDAGGGDPRLAVVAAPPLAAGWMGKQWACAAGALRARGALLLFVDADTRLGPDLVPRAVHAMRARDAALLSLVGAQRMETFWERVVQPHVLVVLAGRYGSTERIAAARSPDAKIANGQCLLVRRDAYDAVGGHGAVRANVSEDLMLAKRVFAAGFEVALVLAPNQLATRMYDSLDGIVRGWGKNMYAGGRESMPLGRLGQLLFPLLLLFPPLLSLLPPLVAFAGIFGIVAPETLEWATLGCALCLGWWGLAYRRLGLAVGWAATWPLGAAVLLWIVVGAILRGRRVEWRGRSYVTA